MQQRETIELVTTYKDGRTTKEKTVTVMAKASSLTRSEFYSAVGVGLNPKYIYTIWPQEYELADVVVDDITYHATHVKAHNTIYEIIRTYSKNNSVMQLTVG